MTIGQEFQGSFRHHFHLKCTQNPLELRDDVFFIESAALLALATCAYVCAWYITGKISSSNSSWHHALHWYSLVVSSPRFFMHRKVKYQVNRLGENGQDKNSCLFGTDTLVIRMSEQVSYRIFIFQRIVNFFDIFIL